MCTHAACCSDPYKDRGNVYTRSLLQRPLQGQGQCVHTQLAAATPTRTGAMCTHAACCSDPYKDGGNVYAHSLLQRPLQGRGEMCTHTACCSDPNKDGGKCVRTQLAAATPTRTGGNVYTHSLLQPALPASPPSAQWLYEAPASCLGSRPLQPAEKRVQERAEEKRY